MIVADFTDPWKVQNFKG